MYQHKIPKRYELLGYTIDVRIRKKPGKFKDPVYAAADLDNLTVDVQPPGADIHEDLRLQAFWHETFHQILDKLDYSSLCHNEKLVDLLVSCTLQVLKTCKY